MEKVERFGVSMPSRLADQFDRLIERKGYKNRSAAIRDIIRSYLVEQEWTADDAEVIGTVTLVYDHHTHDVGDELVDIQHQSHDCVLCSQHVHLDEHNCLETIVMRGASSEVKKLADVLIGARGVKHGRLVCTTTGKTLV